MDCSKSHSSSSELIALPSTSELSEAADLLMKRSRCDAFDAAMDSFRQEHGRNGLQTHERCQVAPAPQDGIRPVMKASILDGLRLSMMVG